MLHDKTWLRPSKSTAETAKLEAIQTHRSFISQLRQIFHQCFIWSIDFHNKFLWKIVSVVLPVLKNPYLKVIIFFCFQNYRQSFMWELSMMTKIFISFDWSIPWFVLIFCSREILWQNFRMEIISSQVSIVSDYEMPSWGWNLPCCLALVAEVFYIYFIRRSGHLALKYYCSVVIMVLGCNCTWSYI